MAEPIHNMTETKELESALLCALKHLPPDGIAAEDVKAVLSRRGYTFTTAEYLGRTKAEG